MMDDATFLFGLVVLLCWVVLEYYWLTVERKLFIGVCIDDVWHSIKSIAEELSRPGSENFLCGLVVAFIVFTGLVLGVKFAHDAFSAGESLGFWVLAGSTGILAPTSIVIGYRLNKRYIWRRF